MPTIIYWYPNILEMTSDIHSHRPSGAHDDAISIIHTPTSLLPDAQFKLAITKLPTTDFHFIMFRGPELNGMSTLLRWNQPYGILFYPNANEMKELNRMSNNQFEIVVKTEFQAIIHRANKKREELIYLLYHHNPYASCLERCQFYFIANVIIPWRRCVAANNLCLTIISLGLVPMGMIIAGILASFAFLLDILICYSCRTCMFGYSREYVAWVKDQLKNHPELDTEAVDHALCEEMQELCRKLTILLDKRTDFWTGVETVENGSSPSYDRDDFVILINPLGTIRQPMESIAGPLVA
jgi:hypothetical protein